MNQQRILTLTVGYHSRATPPASESQWVKRSRQNPAPLGGGMIKLQWFKNFTERPEFDFIFQSWDTASKAGELNDYSVCTT